MTSDSIPVRSHRDHLWAPLAIAAASGLEVCATWTGIGSRSGFPVIRLPFGIARIPTDFCLMVCMEAYSAYALLIWLRASGRRSGPFAMHSGIAAIVLSLTAQVAYHVTGAGTIPPRWLIGLVSALPVVALLLAVLLIHLVRLDREEDAQAERAAADRTELARLTAETAAWKAAWGQAVASGEAGREAARAEAETAAAGELAALRAELGALGAKLETAQKEAAQTAQDREILARKLDAAGRARKRANPPRAKGATARARQAREEDVDARTRALAVLAAEPGISGAELGPRAGMSKRWGQLHKAELAAMAADLDFAGANGHQPPGHDSASDAAD
jgi:hypothetical protein